MSNKIDGSNERYPPPVSRTAATRATSSVTSAEHQTVTKPAAGTPPRGDALSLTADAQLLQQTQSAARGAPDVDSKRVDDVRRALADGSYRADAKAIAARLLKTEWEIYER